MSQGLSNMRDHDMAVRLNSRMFITCLEPFEMGQFSQGLKKVDHLPAKLQERESQGVMFTVQFRARNQRQR